MPVEGNSAPAGALPPPQSSHDERPPVAAPTVGTTGVTKQAGIGGTQAYGRAGVLETGGSLGFTAGSDYTEFHVSPLIGFFFIDNVELSAIGRFGYSKTGSQPAGTEGALLVEPSFHLPFTDALFGFLGVGAGVQGRTGATTGFSLAPRIGLNVLVGRSGVFTPDFTFSYTTSKADTNSAGQTVAVLSSSYGFNAGFTVMW
ncbi:MAG: hypothetical protein NVS3B20_10150 [Polyangiales bacterium]